MHAFTVVKDTPENQRVQKSMEVVSQVRPVFYLCRILVSPPSSHWSLARSLLGDSVAVRPAPPPACRFWRHHDIHRGIQRTLHVVGYWVCLCVSASKCTPLAIVDGSERVPDVCVRAEERSRASAFSMRSAYTRSRPDLTAGPLATRQTDIGFVCASRRPETARSRCRI